MKSLFVKKNETVDVVIAMAKDADGEVFVSNDKEALSKQESVVIDTLEEHIIVFSVPNYGNSVDIYGDSVKIEASGMKIDPISLRRNKFITLLKSWTFVDENDKPIPATSPNVMMLNVELANLIIDELERIVGQF